MTYSLRMAFVFFWLSLMAPASDSLSGTFDGIMVDDAMGLPLLSFGTVTNYPYGRVGPGVHYLSIVAFVDPHAKSSTGNLVTERVVEHLSNVVSAGHEPELRGVQFGWHDHHLAGIVALSRYTPSIWGQLSPSVQSRLNWIMRIGTYVGNIQHNAENDCYLDMRMASSGNYTPNQRNEMVAWMSYAYIFFGGAAQVNNMLAAFDYNLMMGKLAEYEWTRISDTMALSETAMLMQQGGSATTNSCDVNPDGVRKSFSFKGRVVSGAPACPDWYNEGSEVAFRPFELLRREEFDYNLAAMVVDQACKVSGPCSEAGHIPEGFASPHLGELGMFLEYNLNGRSSRDYVNWGAKSALFHYLTLIVTGFWDSNNHKYIEVASRFKIAVDVWKYRIENGWFDPAPCSVIQGVSSFAGIDIILSLWDSVNRPENTWAYGPVIDTIQEHAIPAPHLKLRHLTL